MAVAVLLKLLTVIATVFAVLCNFVDCNGHWGTSDGVAAYPYYRGVAEMAPGSVWPQPQNIETNETVFVVETDVFEFTNVGLDCSMVTGAFERYYDLIFYPPRGMRAKKTTDKLRKLLRTKITNFGGLLTRLEVNLQSSCEDWPSQDMDETYQVDVTSDPARLTAKTNWGILRGLESFSQLLYTNEFGAFQVNATQIDDFPRFKHRGTMLDTSRHFLSKKVILQNLDAMSYNKYNVFHWHIVDDQSFPYQSKVFPLLSQKGAFNPHSHIYSINDIAEIIEYARVRGIRVIPEFDTPGHSYSWGKGYPDLLTTCYKEEGGQLVADDVGPMNPIVNSTYDFVKTLFNEVTRLFPDKYLHLGGDEVPFDCWKSNPDVVSFMKDMGFGDDYSKLEEYYMTRVIGDLPSDTSYVVWQEIVDNGVKVKPDTVVHVWKDVWQIEMAFVAFKGLHMLLSSCWYINYVKYGVHWGEYYNCEPYAFNASAEAEKIVLGGEACIWGEYMDSTNVISTFWPNAQAPAERLWSAKTVNDTTKAAPRYEEQRCRTLRRGINAAPGNGPSFCDVDMYVS